jgi:hypothetical protein
MPDATEFGIRRSHFAPTSGRAWRIHFETRRWVGSSRLRFHVGSCVGAFARDAGSSSSFICGVRTLSTPLTLLAMATARRPVFWPWRSARSRRTVPSSSRHRSSRGIVILNAKCPAIARGGGELAELFSPSERKLAIPSGRPCEICIIEPDAALGGPQAFQNYMKEAKASGPDQFPLGRARSFVGCSLRRQAFGLATRSWYNDYEFLQSKTRNFT